MLVLTRKLGESIVVGGNIVVSIQSILSNRVKLGIQAPAKVRVMRSELKTARSEGPDESIETASGSVSKD